MSKNTVTLREIAQAAEVSLGAVSKVLGGSKCNIRVSEEKAALIRATAQRLNYRPNITARRLAGGSGRIIGIIIDSGLPIHYYHTVTCIENALSDLDYRTMISESHGSATNFIHAHRTLLQYGIDGVICISHDYPGENHLIEEYFNTFPNTVFIGRPVAGTHLVDLDWLTSTEHATRHLLASGRRHLALVMGSIPYVSRQDRAAGFQKALSDYPEAIATSQIIRIPDQECEYCSDELVESLGRLPDGLDGIILENDLKAMIMMRILHQRGIRIPEDVALIGHNNEEFSAHCFPALTTVDELSRAQAEAAISLLMQQLSPNPPNGPQQLTVIPELKVRESAP
jgi:DNA-binding LacI/PurR family transcriptional regulator